MQAVLNDQQLLTELSPDITRLYDHHVEISHRWDPQLLVTYSDALDYADTDPKAPPRLELPKPVVSALIVNSLTEDNLPYYTSYLLGVAEGHEGLRTWVMRWVSEENDHQYTMRAWLDATGAVNPFMLNRLRDHQVSTGQVPTPNTVPRALVYTTLQEGSTRIAHTNTGRALGKDHRGNKTMSTIAGDEAKHRNFYFGLAAAGLQLEPSRFVVAMHDEIANFEMPGTGIKGFRLHAARISMAGIYGVTEFLKNADDTLAEWEVWDVPDAELTDEAKQARDALVVVLDDYRDKAREEQAKRQGRAAKEATA